DVLMLDAEGELAALDLALDALEALRDRRAVGPRDDATFCQHSRVRDRAGDVLGIKPLVDLERGVDRLHDVARRCGETSAPSQVCPRRIDGRFGPCCAHRAMPFKMKFAIRALTVLL